MSRNLHSNREVKKRLKRAVKEYPKGVFFKSAFTGFIFQSSGACKIFQAHQHFTNDIMDASGGVIYNAKTNKWAEIVDGP